ncbi:hypothetical protein SAMN05192563_1012202 [Paraburkholderia aspalathi]|uniref:Uncharacterized protein n=1 Tax=Paraburkholderia aspalathi TaxID=1324617 RepID=A0A1I7DZD6_9BURK|nr:hypothetical protein R75465_04004 [Paraburkholderia aspalathi]SFU17051.1 hypothetical protein SAMN05192563_1012202 [Paraburkholderia aspalathi]
MADTATAKLDPVSRYGSLGVAAGRRLVGLVGSPRFR